MADINRSEVSTIIQEAYSQTLLQAAVAGSTVLTAFPTVNLGTKLTHLPVLATLPEAGWVTESADSTGVKPTSEVNWSDLTMVVEELAVIIPIHEDVLADATAPILEEVTRRAGEAIGKKLDQAVIFGVGKPASWTSAALYPAASTASQTTTYTTGTANTADLVGGVTQAARQVAAAGFMPDVMLAPLTFRYDVINVRDSTGQPVWRDEQFAGFNTVLNRNGAWTGAGVQALVADSSRIRLGVRQDITVKFLDQATVGTLNLAERDMIALRFKARYAYVLGKSTTSLGTNKTPVAALVNSGS
jgi:HK97 family phage major capsid protein